MKILFVGDYSNLHACLAGSLRRMGHDVTVLSDGGGYMRTDADICISRGEGLRGSLRYLASIMRVWPSLKGFDVVQLINPHFLRLKPGKLAYFFHELKRNNGAVYLTLCGNDHFFVRECVRGAMFRFSEFRAGIEPTPFALATPERESGYLLPEVARFADMLYSEIDGGMSVLPEYDMAARPILADRLHYTGIPLDLSRHPFAGVAAEGPTRVFVGMKPEMSLQKGTALLLDVARRLEKKHPADIVVEKVGGVSYQEYLSKMRAADVVIDQLYSYSPATNALDAMALGKVAATGGEPEYFDRLGIPDGPQRDFLIPLSPLIDDLEAYLEAYLLDKSRLVEMGRRARKIVETHNSDDLVASRFLDIWQKN